MMRRQGFWARSRFGLSEILAHRFVDIRRLDCGITNTVGGFGSLQELGDMNKPVMCALNGICCGGGLGIAHACNIILAADHATFALPESRSGTVTDAASVKLPKRIPHHVAMEIMSFNRMPS